MDGAREGDDEGQRVKLSDAASYDANAGDFDALTERFAAPLAERMLDLAGLSAADALLDVGTGSGLVALRAAARTPQGRAVGIDHSVGMLQQARDKAKRLNVAATFSAMDAEALEFPDASFDAVVSLFVLRHLPNPAAATQEMHRMLKSGGRLVVGIGSGPSPTSPEGLAAAARVAWSKIEHARGRLLEAPRFLQELMAARGWRAAQDTGAHHHGIDVRRMMANAGFSHVETTWLGRVVELEPEDFWSVQATYSSPERMRLAELPADQVTELKRNFIAKAEHVRAAGGRLVYRYGAMFYTAVKSGRA
ncbi:class I SAM-dependent methyltransferase [Phenylobacterium sp.]|uniref:class I SAM-dependent methyltransferase n=1 Tax=Phenylobacterium sp. TaxID=1871053 RepID=UPI002733EB3D|nr:methyltransferase domain-containing protein [Phenylobacterium sp.]MDP3659113.1 methyltransferase domain-containing protein [Phenylobacterium sp.]